MSIWKSSEIVQSKTNRNLVRSSFSKGVFPYTQRNWIILSMPPALSTIGWAPSTQMCVGAEKGQPSKFKAAASTAATSKMACPPPPPPSKEHGERFLVKLVIGNLIGWKTFSVYVQWQPMGGSSKGQVQNEAQRLKGIQSSGVMVASPLTMTLTYVMVSLLFYALANFQHHGNV